MAANLVCSNTGRTAHVWDAPAYLLPGARANNAVVRCGKKIKVAVVISIREFRSDDYVHCPDGRCTPTAF